jgi:hypothetical protein
MIIKNVRFSYIVSMYHLGPYIDFIPELEVSSLDYDNIVNAILKAHPEYEQIKIMCYSRK